MSAREARLRAARQAGIKVQWTDVAGAPRVVDDAALDAILEALGPQARATQDAAPALLTAMAGQTLAIPGSTAGDAQWIDEKGEAWPAVRAQDGGWQVPDAPGYWQWRQRGRLQAVAAAPARAWYPDPAQGRGDWGLVAQVYSLRATGDGGIGDSAGCLPWLSRMAREGGGALALSPLHASMPVGAGFSPYSPSDRAWLDPLQASPLQVLGDAADAVRVADPDLDARLRTLEQNAQIDWPAAAAAKWQWITRLPAWLQTHQPERWQRIEAELRDAGSPLQAWSRETAVLWHDSAGQQAFAQWLARRAWREVQQMARGRGMRIGLIADLAVGFDPAGVEARRSRGAVMPGLELGAPPDAFNPNGQAWGITGYAPAALEASGYAPFIALLRAVMADRGGIRIDHILGLQRLWVLPRGEQSGAGAYLHYPFDDLLNLLVLESWRHRCVVIGEDLGVVPPGIRDRLAARGVLGMDVLAFSRDDDGFVPPAQWRKGAVAMTSTHDLPPIAGWLAGRDIQWRQRLGWTDDAATRDARRERDVQVGQLTDLARATGVATGDPQTDALALTARSPAVLALLPLEDALALEEQPNLPGTVDNHPNWRRRLPPSVDEGSVSTRLRAFAAARTLPGEPG